MRFEVLVSVEVERTEGPFASRDEIETQIMEAIDGADPGNVEGDNGGQYEVTEWTAEAQEKPKPIRRSKA